MRTSAVVLLFVSLALLVPSAYADKDDDDVVQFGKAVYIGPDQTAGDIVCIGCSVRLAGKATGDVVSVGGSVQVNGDVQGDVVVVGGALQLGPEAVLHGDAAAVGGGLQQAPTAQVKGEVVNQRLPFGLKGMALLLLSPLLGLLLVGVLLAVLGYAILGERRVETIVATLRCHTGLALLAGLGACVAFSVAVTFSHWAGPASLLIIGACSLAMFVIVIVGYTGVSAWVGHRVTSAGAGIGAVVAGAIVVGLLQGIPLLGAIPLLIFGLFALGAAVLSGLGTEPDWLQHQLASHPTAGQSGSPGAGT